jgi:DNA-binding HxlR family transcriptional regulator
MKPKSDYKPDYIMVPYPIYSDQRLESADRIIYGVIYGFEHMREEGHCFASNETLGRIAGISPRSVANNLTQLEKYGYIERIFKDKKKRNRIEIKALISFKSRARTIRSSVIDDTQLGDTHDTQLGEQIEKRDIKKNITPAQGAEKFTKLGADLIKALEAIDPKNKNYYNNTSQRAAADFLIAEYGFDEVVKRIGVLPKTNKIPYFPTITTPVQLRDKWVQLQDAVDRKRGEVANKKVKII